MSRLIIYRNSALKTATIKRKLLKFMREKTNALLQWPSQSDQSLAKSHFQRKISCKYVLRRRAIGLGMVTHTFDPNTRKAEAGRSLRVHSSLVNIQTVNSRPGGAT